jgi:uncharacterized membrane protein
VRDWPAMAVLVGLLASVAYGTSDFIGGLVSRRNHVFTVLLWGQFVGIAMVLFGLPFVGGGPPVASWLWISAVAGVAGVIGAALLFRGLAKGRMGVVGPITGVLAAALPVVFGLLTGERPSPLSLMGVVVALGAIALVSSSPDPDTLRADVGKGAGRGLPEAFGAGICFAAFFIILDGIGDDAGLWPVLGMRLSSVAISGSILVARRVSPRPAPGTGLGVLGGGAVGTTADYLFVVGTRLGLLSVVAVLTSLYPVTTVVLARTFLRERISGMQLAGLLLAAVGVVLITAG